MYRFCFQVKKPGIQLFRMVSVYILGSVLLTEKLKTRKATELCLSSQPHSQHLYSLHFPAKLCNYF